MMNKSWRFDVQSRMICLVLAIATFVIFRALHSCLFSLSEVRASLALFKLEPSESEHMSCVRV